MKAILGPAILAMTCTQAVALSCDMTINDPVTAYQTLAKTGHPFTVMTGRLHYDAGQDTGRFGDMTLQANFVGTRLTPNGLAAEETRDAIVNIWCAETTCGQLPDDVSLLLFIPDTPAQIVLDAGPCGDGNIWNPRPEVVQMLTSCMRGDACLAQPLQ